MCQQFALANRNDVVEVVMQRSNAANARSSKFATTSRRSYACHTAVRSGDRLTPDSMNAVIDQLFATKSLYFCPHGGPVIINIPIEELDKRFGRI